MIRVRLVIPYADKEPTLSRIKKYFQIHGDYYKFHGQSGVIIAGARPDGAWVHFDGQQLNSYVGVPVKYLFKEEAT